jgi:acetyl esterase/lipase
VKILALFCTVLYTFAAASAQPSSTSDKYLEIQTIRLWDGPAPQAVGNTDEDVPTLTLFSPNNAPARHPAVIVVPGGAYKVLASIHEGREVADWFTQHGFTAFVLKYRLGPRYLYPVPLEDAKRAVRLVRAHAQEWGIDPDRIGMLGFSAGGHLTAMAGTTADDGQPNASDPVERASSRLSFMVLGYPWLNAMDTPQEKWLSYCGVMEITGEACQRYEQYSPVRKVSPKTPPTFLFHTADDHTVPVRTSLEFFQALQAAGVPAEMHIYEKGPHGIGFGAMYPALETWPLLLENWLRLHGYR